MDYQNSSIPRLSGLPRPSRIPLSKPALQIPATSSSTHRAESEEPKLASSTSPNALRASTVDRISESTSRQPLLSSSSRHNLKGSVTKAQREDAVFKKPARPVSRPLRKQGQKLERIPRSPSNAEDNQAQGSVQDELGDLDGFRTASRIGLRDSESPPDEVGPPALQTPKPSRKPRLSLSDRTVESLSQISSPLAGTGRNTKRQSNFFTTESPMVASQGSESVMTTRSRPPSRSSTSQGSRPGSSTYVRPISPSKQVGSKYGQPVGPEARAGVASRRRVSSVLPPGRPGVSKPTKPFFSDVSHQTPACNPSAPIVDTSRTLRGNKTVSGRPVQPRPSLTRSFAKPSPGSSILATTRNISTSDTTSFSRSRVTLAERSTRNVEASPKSSSALRTQIAKAKAANSVRTTHKLHSNSEDINPDAFEDPFNRRSDVGNYALWKRIDNARKDGKLNVAAMGLKEIPFEVMEMYEAESMETSSVPWNEVVDLTRLNAAANEIAFLADDLFPDLDGEVLAQAEDGKGNQFGGLERIDLHGNLLTRVPIGFRRLRCLTALNLVGECSYKSRHKLTKASSLATSCRWPALRPSARYQV